MARQWSMKKELERGMNGEYKNFFKMSSFWF